MTALRSRKARLLLGLYSIFLIGAGWFAWDLIRAKRSTIGFAKIDVDRLSRLSQERLAKSHAGPLVPDKPEQWHAFLSVEEATLLMPALKKGKLFLYDPWMYLVGPALRRNTMSWPEHPSGMVNAHTNSVGLRGPLELAKELPELRVLVAGDSHTFGVCKAVETFPALLQVSLLELNPGKTVEVLNAGYGGYTFYNYVGTLLRWRERKPKVMVVAVFAGNDFLEALPFFHFFAGDQMTRWTSEQQTLLASALKAAPNAMAQGLQSAFAFQCMPKEADVAIEAGISTLSEMRAIGEQIGTHILVCFLPNSCAEPFNPPIQQLDSAVAILAKSGFTMDAQTNLEERFVERLRAEGFECVDMRPIFNAEPSPPFWRLDLHLSVRGQALVAGAIQPAVSKLLER